MRSMAGLFLAANILLATLPAAAGAWAYERTAVPLQGYRHTVFAVTDGGRYGFGFQCLTGHPPLAIYLVDESGVGSSAEHVRILVTPDALSPLVLVAHPLADHDARQMVVQSDVPAVGVVLRLLTLAKTRVRVAIRMRRGDIIHSAVFDADGITRALGKMVAACRFD